MDSIAVASVLFFPVYTSLNSTVRALFDATDSIHESDYDSGHDADSEWSGVSWREEEEEEDESEGEEHSFQKNFETGDLYDNEPPSHVCDTPVYTPPSSETESEDLSFPEET